MRAVLVVVAAVLMVPLAPSRAEAISVRDLIELSRAGLGEEVLLALIEVDRPVFPIDTETLRSLKDAGVSERVILAVVRSGRARVEEPVQVAEQPAPQPQVIVIEQRDQTAPQVQQAPVPVPVPVYYPVWIVPRKPAPPPPQPVYWGWGGKLRPDAWQPTPPPPQEKGELIKLAPPIKLEPPVIRR